MTNEKQFDPDEPFKDAYESFLNTGEVTQEQAALVDSGDEPWEAMIEELAERAESGGEESVGNLLLLYRFMIAAGEHYPAVRTRFEEACLDTRGLPIFNALANGYQADSWIVSIGASGLSVSVQVATKSEEEMRDFLS